MGVLYTVGHGTLEIGELTGLLAEAGISGIIDVRSFPGSRRLPHFAREAMAHSVPAAGLGYEWRPAQTAARLAQRGVAEPLVPGLCRLHGVPAVPRRPGPARDGRL